MNPDDTLGILIDADPDAMASAMALKRLFWRKVRKASIFHINRIQRADNLAFVRFLHVEQNHVSEAHPEKITKWAILDSQPAHHEQLSSLRFDVIVDHHPFHPQSQGGFIDVREHYGANSTIMTEYLKAAKIRPSMRLATALFYGIKTDTDNFVRDDLSNDIDAFRYLYRYANMNVIKKIESSEMTRKTLSSYHFAMKNFKLRKDIAYIYMGAVENPDILVMIADFFMRLAEATWCIVAGTYDGKFVVILRNVGIRGDAGKTAQRLFGHGGGSAGGHRTAARAEITLDQLKREMKGLATPERFFERKIKSFK
jgi:nanoRNase/pAp phosphatase (c-di-AMP/oligoRNAs hydrolase)